jgi:radical SAM-linked protein
MKIRLRYKKTEAGRYLSHLDLARTMERALRRAEIPLAFSEGFNPHPKMSFASALAVGITGENEYLDVELRRRMNLERIKEQLQAAMPAALELCEVREIPIQSKSLSAQINLAEYSFIVCAPHEDIEKIQQGIDKLLAAKEVWRQPLLKPGKKPIPAKEVRGLLRWIKAQEHTKDTIMISLALNMNNTGQLRPQEVWQMVAEFGGFAATQIRQVCRTGLYFEHNGQIFMPMGGDLRNAQRNIDAGGRH